MFKNKDFIWRGEQSKNKFLSILTTNNDVLNDLGIPYDKNLEKDED